MWGAHRAALSAGAGVAVAGCLALALFLAPQRRPAVNLAQAQTAGASIDEIDFENHEGVVLQNGGTTTIWVDDHSPVQK
jgi:hypothetical protein